MSKIKVIFDEDSIINNLQSGYFIVQEPFNKLTDCESPSMVC